jgi:hypothetical protein
LMSIRKRTSGASSSRPAHSGCEAVRVLDRLGRGLAAHGGYDIAKASRNSEIIWGWNLWGEELESMVEKAGR